jgi:hypothetical protein
MKYNVVRPRLWGGLQRPIYFWLWGVAEKKFGAVLVVLSSLCASLTYRLKYWDVKRSVGRKARGAVQGAGLIVDRGTQGAARNSGARGEVGFPVGRIAFQDATWVAGRTARRGTRGGVGSPSEGLSSGWLGMRGWREWGTWWGARPRSTVEHTLAGKVFGRRLSPGRD